MRSALRRWGIAWPDALVAIAFSLYAMTATLLAPADDLTGPRGVAVVLFGLAPLPLMLGRRRPVIAVCSMSAIVFVIQFAVSDITRTSVPLILLIWAAFIAGAYAGAPKTYLLAALFPIMVCVVDVLSQVPQETGDYVFPSLILLTAWFVGRLVHARAAVARRLAEQTEQLEREREELAQAAVLAERSRIARELHDVVAHSVSVMVVQAGAARRVLPRSAEESAAALATVQEVGREALDDLRRTLGFLRPAGEPAAFEPAPGLDRLDDLAERARRAGLPVTLTVEGEAWPLPPALGLTAYRIIQEALTNTIKHAGASHATVAVRWGPEELLLDVCDTGRARPAGRGGAPRSRPAAVLRPRSRRHARARSPRRRHARGGPDARRRLPRPRAAPTSAGCRLRERRDPRQPLRGAPARMTDPVRVLIVDDQALVRTGFRMILDEEESLRVVGEAADGLEAVELAKGLKPDVVLMDIRMPGIDGLEATRRILAEPHDPPIRVLVLTTFDLNEYVYEALRAGASGFLLKDVPTDQLVAGVHVVASGEALLAPTVTRRLIEEFSRHAPAPEPPPAMQELTARELEVFGLIARGLSNAEIAAELVVSEATVKTHVARVLMKLGLRDRIQAVVLAYETGVVTPGARAADQG